MQTGTDNLSVRQRVLKFIYPVVRWAGKLFPSDKKILGNVSGAKPVFPLYDLDITLNNGSLLSLHQLKGKKILLVNTASDCGYTPQYEGLQELADQFGSNLVVIGFPSNDFKEQEKGSDESIAEFCKINYGISFPLARKTKVTQGEGQHEIFQWLTDSGRNGWCDQQPRWNFSKYLVNEVGVLTHYFDTVVPPLDNELVNAIRQKP